MNSIRSMKKNSILFNNPKSIGSIADLRRNSKVQTLQSSSNVHSKMASKSNQRWTNESPKKSKYKKPKMSNLTLIKRRSKQKQSEKESDDAFATEQTPTVFYENVDYNKNSSRYALSAVPQPRLDSKESIKMWDFDASISEGDSEDSSIK